MTALLHERPEAMPEIRTDPEPVSSLSELDEVVWQAWKAIELPEANGARVEIPRRHLVQRDPVSSVVDRAVSVLRLTEVRRR